MNRTCPGCRATLDDNLAEHSGGIACPFCGEDVSHLFDEPAGHQSARDPLDDYPPGGLIQVVEDSADRLVIAIPPGGTGTSGIGCFAVLWNGITLAVGGGFLVAAVNEPSWELLIPLGVISLFLVIGLVLIYMWVRAKYMTTYVLLERDRLAVQRILFGRKSTTITHVTEDSTAALGVSYTQNDDPVYHVEVPGTNRTERFGVRLGDEEKRWLVRAINGFLHGDRAAAAMGDGAIGDGLDEDRDLANERPTESIEPLGAHQLPTDSMIRVHDSFVDGLRFSLPVVTGGFSTGCGLGCSLFGGIWIAVAVGTAMAGGKGWEVIALIGPLFFGAFGLMALIGGLMAWFGRLTVTVGSDDVRLKWHLGPVGITRRLPFDTVTAVGLGRTYESRSNGRVTASAKGAILVAAGQSYTLTTTHGEETGREVGGLLIAALENRGVRLEELEDTDDAP